MYVFAPTVAAQGLPRQLIFEPVGPPPAIDLGRASLDLTLHGYELPDDRRAEDYRLRAWWRPAERHDLSMEIHYVGIETDDRIIYAGGPFGLQWSLELPGFAGLSWASDVSARLPVGDGDFHPLSAKASSVEWNVRAGFEAEAGSSIHLSWWVRRVSQPTNRVDPQRYFPSGSGASVHGRLQLGALHTALIARQDLGGASSASWLGLRLGYRVDEELSLELGFSTQLAEESAEDRLFDRAWSLAARWNPAPLQEEGEPGL